MLNLEMEAFEKRRAELESAHKGKWVVFHEAKLVNIYDTFDAAAEDAVRQFGRGPYLIRQVGAPPMTPPPSVMWRPHSSPNVGS